MLFSYDEWPGGHNIATTPRMWRRILEQWGGTIGLNFDPSHLVLQMIDMRRFLKEFGAARPPLPGQGPDDRPRRALRARRVLDGHGLADPAHPGPRRGRLVRRLLRALPGRASRATASSSTRTAASRAPTRRSSRASSSRGTSSGRTASSRPQAGAPWHSPSTASPSATSRRPSTTRSCGRSSTTRSSRTAAGWRRGTTSRRCACARPTSGGRGRSSTGTDVAVGTTIGFPHGNHATEIKVLEARAGPRRRRHRAGHGDPDRRPEVRPGRRRSRPTSGPSSRWRTRPGPSSR